MLYRDLYCDKPPLVVVTHALSQVLFGHSMRSIRVLDLFCVGAGALLVARLGSVLLRRRGPATLAAVLFVYSYFRLNYWMTAQQEAWVATGSALAVLLVSSVALGGEPASRRGILLLFLAGLTVSIACFYKYTAALLLPGLALLVLVGGRSRERVGVAWLWLGLGFVVPIVGMALWLGSSGALSGFLDSQVRWMRVYAGIREAEGAGASRRFLGHLFEVFRPVAVLASLAVAWTLVRLARAALRGDRESLRAPAVIWIWLLAAAAGVIAQGKYFTYHYVALLPPLALLAVWGLTDSLGTVWATVRPRAFRTLLPAVGVLLLLLLQPYRQRFADLVDVARGKVPIEEYWARPDFETPYFSFRDNLLLAELLREHTRPDDRVNIWGEEPAVNFLARRDVVGRFSFCFPLGREANLPELRAEYVAAVTADPPEYFVIERGDFAPFALGHEKDSYATFEELDALKKLVSARYTLRETVGSLDKLGLPGEPRFLVFGLRGRETSW